MGWSSRPHCIALKSAAFRRGREGRDPSLGNSPITLPLRPRQPPHARPPPYTNVQTCYWGMPTGAPTGTAKERIRGAPASPKSTAGFETEFP
eukprot:gene23218-biopygen22295